MSPDPQLIFTSTLVKLTSIIAAKAAMTIGSYSSKTLKKVLSNEKNVFDDHIHSSFDKCTKMKTMVSGDTPVSLAEIYISLRFKNDQKSFDQYEIMEEIDSKRFVIINGFAGGGKSMFMRYLWLSTWEKPDNYVPIYVELRRFNEITSNDFLVFLHRYVCGPNTKIDQEDFVKILKEGGFYFIFDGFDEIRENKRIYVENFIVEMSRIKSSSPMIVSGRPDDIFSGWQNFCKFDVCPLNKKEVIELIEKIPFDLLTKNKFKSRIKKDLFESHTSFLSSPLLATLMLKTFNEFADFPEKIHVFYDQVFDALFATYDAKKEVFSREKFSRLGIDQFKIVLSFFCLRTYLIEEFEFSFSETIRYINEAKKFANIECDEEQYFKDMYESINLIHQDGTRYTFIHRSMQEYFAAYCIGRQNFKDVRAILRKLSKRKSDNVIYILKDMRREYLEDEFIIPELTEIVNNIKPFRKSVHVYLNQFFNDITFHFHNNTSNAFSSSFKENYSVIRHLSIVYNLDINSKESKSINSIEAVAIENFRAKYKLGNKDNFSLKKGALPTWEISSNNNLNFNQKDINELICKCRSFIW